MSDLTKAEVLAAWSAGREVLLKGQTSSPGLPVAPNRLPMDPPRHTRAPKRLAKDPRAFFDPMEQASHPGTPESVQPITLGDLIQLKQASAVELMPQRSTGVKTTIKTGGDSRVATKLSDEARRDAALEAGRSTRNATAVRLQQVGKRLARLRGTRPVHNAPQNFHPE